MKTAKGQTPALAVSPKTVAARVNVVPFTRIDFVLLLTGGAMLLVIGSSIRRVRVEHEEMNA